MIIRYTLILINFRVYLIKTLISSHVTIQSFKKFILLCNAVGEKGCCMNNSLQLLSTENFISHLNKLEIVYSCNMLSGIFIDIL